MELFRKKSVYGWLFLIRNLMMTSVVLAVILNCSVILIGSKRMIQSGHAIDYLYRMNHIPASPIWGFITCLMLLFIMGAFFLSRSCISIPSRKINMTGALIELVCALVISAILHFSYSGILLLVFCDGIFHFRSEPNTNTIIFTIIILYFFCNYQMINSIIPMTDVSLYFSAFPEGIHSLLMVLKNLLDMLSFILCLSFLGIFLSWQLEENQNILEEVSMLNQVNQTLKDYAQTTEKIGETRERKRLAREIHDTLGHALTGIAAGVDATIAMIDKNPQAEKKQLLLVSQVVRQGIGDVRASLKKLRPGALEQKGLQGALQSMISEFCSVSDLQVALEYEADSLDLEVAKEDVLFRVIQESMTNSVRHGSADWLKICFRLENSHLHISIQDNGIGCHQIEMGYGLSQMRERIASIGGTVEFDGKQGFQTQIEIPLRKGEYE